MTAQNVAGDQMPEVALHAPGVWSVTASGAIKARLSLDNGHSETRWVAALIECVPIIEGEKDANGCLIAAAPDMLSELRTAVRHIEHMAAWIGKQSAGYSFESLGENMPGIRAAIAKAEGR